MATESKPIVVDVKESENKPLATGESSGAKDEVEQTSGGFFYENCGGNPITGLVGPGLGVAAVLVLILGFAAYVSTHAAALS